MNSTDLPVTEWWDPEFGYYDVPIAAEGVPYDVWWSAYEHIAEIEWITTGRTWGWPDGLFARQLTTGWDFDPSPNQALAYLAPPRCTCLPVWEDNGDGWAVSSTSCYTINPACAHHGDRPWS